MSPRPEHLADDGRVALASGPHPAPVPYAVEEPEPPPPTDTTLGYTPGRVLRALRRRWYAAIPAGLLLAAVLGCVADEFVASNYTVRTQVSIAINQPGILADGGGGDLSTYQRRQTALVKSRHVLQAALNRPGVSELAVVRNNPDPVGWLETNLQADFRTSPDILKVTLSGPDPAEFVALLNAVREAYLEHGVNRDATEKKGTLDRVHGLIEDDKVKLDAARLAVTKKAEEFRSPDALAARQRHMANVTHLANLRTQLFQLDGTVQGWEQTRTDLLAHPPAKDATAAPSKADLEAATKLAVQADPRVQAGRAEVAKIQKDYDAIVAIAVKGADDPKAVDRRRELDETMERVAAREAVVRDDAVRMVAAESNRDYEFRLREHTARVADLKVQIDRTKGQMTAVAAAVEKLDSSTLAEARGIAELDRLAARTTEVEDRLKAAKGRAEAIEIELKAPPRAQTHETAVVTQVPNPSKKLMMVAGAMAVGFLAGLLGVAFLDLRSGRIDSTDGVDRHLHTGVVGYIPRLTAGALAALVRSSDGPAGSAAIAACDAADACRTLLLNALGSGPKVIMVTSSSPGEGKTALTAQLALSLGRAGKRTLLIDGDIRKPGTHTLFGESLGPGLTDVLRKTHALPNVVRPGPLPNVCLVPAGVCNPQEAVSLLQLRLGSLIRKCRPHFDVILIDTSPLLNLPDAMVIGRHADGTILSLMNEVSTLPDTQTACARLRTLNLPLLGAVLNGARVKAPLGY